MDDYVSNQPYTAQTVTTWIATEDDGTRVPQKTISFQARDSQGRTCLSGFPGNDTSKPPRTLCETLFIPLRRQFIQLAGPKTARVTTWPGTGPIPKKRDTSTAIMIEKLGGQMIHGIYAEGTRATWVRQSNDVPGQNIYETEEAWVSPDLKIVVRVKNTSTYPGSSDSTSEIVQLDRNEPDPALFEIPADYTIENQIVGSDRIVYKTVRPQ
jgi:hypothetical protein